MVSNGAANGKHAGTVVMSSIPARPARSGKGPADMGPADMGLADTGQAKTKLQKSGQAHQGQPQEDLANGDAALVKRSRKRRSGSKTTSRQADFAFEKCGFDRGYDVIAGIDEAGRGPWAGPVVSAAVVLDPNNIPDGIADSKKLTEAKREVLFEEILRTSKTGIAFADAERIDRDNILSATMWSMQRAVAELNVSPDLLLIDGNRAPQFDCAVETIVKGDALSLSIAAASIVAKVSRDRMMRRLDEQYPDYGFGQHKGYGTAQHRRALAQLGATPLHRHSFKPVRDAVAAANP